LKAYLKRFAPVALSEGRKFGIRPSFILAKACIESVAREAAITQNGNNHFGLTCTPDWFGAKQDQRLGQCFRKYENAWVSYRDFSVTFSSYNKEKKDYLYQSFEVNNLIEQYGLTSLDSLMFKNK
jgi:flagellum-specific peptidoglycan hydrolase FlgJ